MADAIACDVHTHLIPVEEGNLGVEPGIVWNAGASTLVVDGHKVGMADLFDATKLVAWMDANAVAHAFVSVPPPVYREQLGETESRRWADRINAGLKAVAASYPDRLSALIHLPIHCPAAAAAVAADALVEGNVAFSAPTGAPGVQLADAAFDTLWQSLSNSRAFLFMHPGSCADGRLESFYMTNLVGNPHETGVALASLALGGVLDRFPGIQFCFAHGGGSAPMLAARLERGHFTARPGIDRSLSPPQKLFGNVLVDCITHSEPALELAESVFGSGNVVFGSDWPFPMGIVDPAKQLAGIDAERRRRICCSGAIRLNYKARSKES